MDTKEFRKQIARRFIDSLIENPKHWQRQWSVAGERPENCVSHTEYRGVNRFNLMYAAIEKGSNDMRWATFKQIQQQGWHLRKGAKAEQVEFWQPYDKSIHSAVSWDEYSRAENKDNYMLLSRYHQVFNAKDIVGIPPVEKVNNNITQNEAVDRIIKGMGIEVSNDGRSKAYYSMRTDTIHIPLKEKFYDDYAYNSTLLHELSHATGAQTRLARVQSGNMASTEYAIEELVAEISSCFAGADIGLQYENAGFENHFENHQAYVSSWIREIENKPEVLLNAIKQADQAADYLLEKGGLLQNKGEEVISTEEHSWDNARVPETYNVAEKGELSSTVNEYVECLVKNNDFSSNNDFMNSLQEGKEEVVGFLKWRALGGTGLNEKTPEGYKEACGKLLGEISPEDYKGFESSMETCEQFKKDLIDNGFKPTENLMNNYIALLEEKENGIISTVSLSEVSEIFRKGSSDMIINEIGKELMTQELQQMEALEACP